MVSYTTEIVFSLPFFFFYKSTPLKSFINYYQQMHYIAIKITQITVFYVIIRAPTCFDPPGSSSGSSECPY